jgi:hypothetical protein
LYGSRRSQIASHDSFARAGSTPPSGRHLHLFLRRACNVSAAAVGFRVACARKTPPEQGL